MRKYWIAAVVIAIIAVAAGFAIGHNSATKTTAVTPAVTAQPSASSGARTSPSPTSQTVACTSASLKLALRSDNSGAGHHYFDLIFTNSGSATCTLFGYPGVSLIDAGGNQLGQPAERSNGTSSTITLAPGEASHALIDFPAAANFQAGSCSTAATN